MIRINLLPWRATKYEQTKKQWLFYLIVVIAAAIFVVLIWHVYLSYSARILESRINQLNNQWQILQGKIKNTKKFEKHYNEILNSIKIINKLHINKYKVAYCFNHLPKLMPGDVHLRSLRYSKDRLMLIGDTRSNKSIPQLIDNIKQTNWLKKPNLEILSHAQDGTITFQIKTVLSAPNILQREEKNDVT
jgi:Tfp pilus assembly protein PilN